MTGFALDSCSLRGRKIQIQVSRAVELEGCCAVDLAHGNAQVSLVGVDEVQAVVRGEDSDGGEGRTVLEDNGKGLRLGLGGCRGARRGKKPRLRPAICSF